MSSPSVALQNIASKRDFSLFHAILNATGIFTLYWLGRDLAHIQRLDQEDLQQIDKKTQGFAQELLQDARLSFWGRLFYMTALSTLGVQYLRGKDLFAPLVALVAANFFFLLKAGYQSEDNSFSKRAQNLQENPKKA